MEFVGSLPQRGCANMPQSLSAVYLHAVFSTKERRPFLRDPMCRIRLHAYLGEVSRRLGCPSIIAGGTEDRIHQLIRLGRTITQADWVKEIKRASSLWVKRIEPRFRNFTWQAGYGFFSVSPSDRDAVRQYSPARKNTTGRLRSRMNFARCSSDMDWNGMNALYGIRAQPFQG